MPLTLFSLTVTLAFTLAATAKARGAEASPQFGDSRWSLSGFGTLGAARASNNRIEILRDASQPKPISDRWSGRTDSAFGIQTGFRFNESLDVVVQGVSHYQNDGSFRPDITWSFIKYDLTPRFSIRLGRVGIEYLMQADARLVGYSYLPIRPPVEFYGVVPINYGDGIDARYRWPVGDGIFRIEGFAGNAAANLPRYQFKGTKIFKGSLGYDLGAWQFSYINTQAKLAHNMDSLASLMNGLSQAGAPGVARSLELQGKVSTYQSLGVAYDDGTWQFQGAVNAIRHESAQMQNSQALYLLAGYRYGSLTPYLGYAQAKNSPKSLESGLQGPFFATLNAGLAQTLQASQIDSRTLTAGLRWDIRRNMDVKAQLDLVRAARGSTLLIHNMQPNTDARTTLFSLSLDFIF